MKKTIRYIGLDVHAETIAVAVAEEGRDGEVRSLGTIPNTSEAVRQLVKKLGPAENLRVCYEAGPTGYVLYWQLTQLGVACEVVAPTLIPVKTGDRVKTDRRDAVKLARCYRAGELTAVWVPDSAHEALRDLVRAREAAMKDQLRARHRLSKFLLRHGRRPPAGVKAWTERYLKWVNTVRFDQPAQEATVLDYKAEVEHAAARIVRLEQAMDEAVNQAPAAMQAVVHALQALRGVAKLTAATIVAEAGQLSRFASAKQLMSYGGVVSSEYSTGKDRRQGAITKTGNAHLRRVVVEAAWSYRHHPHVAPTLRKRQQGLSPSISQIAWKAQHRLHKRFLCLQAASKPHQKVVTAVGRELLGFIWAIGVEVERTQAQPAVPPVRLVA
jgi:transposase